MEAVPNATRLHVERLSEAMRHQAIALEASPYPVAYLDFEGKFLRASIDFPRPVDATPELQGHSIWDWIPSDQHPPARDFFAACADGTVVGGASPEGPVSRVAEPASLPLACVVHPGVHLLLYPARGPGRPLGVLAVALPDMGRMTDTQTFERREIHYRRRLTAVLEASREVSSSLDRDLILQNVVQRVRDLVAVPEAVLFLVGEDGETLAPVVAHVDSFYEEVMALRLRKGDGIVGWVAQTGRSEIVNHAENDSRSLQVPGTPVEPTSLLCAPLLMKDRVVGVLALTRLGGEDFEREDLELATIFAGHCSAAIENARLYAELRTTVEELRTTQNQLVQSAKINALGEMAGGVAHDFNNILSAILGRTQLLLRQVMDKDTRESLSVIERTALDGAHTVKRIQEFTRVRHDESSESVSLNQVMLEVVDVTRTSWQAGAKARGEHIQVDTDLTAKRPVSGSAAELREVFTNLLLNAVDALPTGGTIRISTADEGDRVVARVADDGIGMDEETKARAFDPFFTTKREKGTGLGLSVAYGILRRHHADIAVETQPGGGATFVIGFPACTAAPAPPAPRAEVPEAPCSLSVLCVDDDPAVLDVLCDLVEALGHRVERASTGAEAIEMACRLGPDVVLSDLGMPDVNGWQVAAGVKVARPDTLVALVTGWGVQLEREPARQRGVDLILPKPFTLEEVGRVLLQAAGMREGRSAA